MTRPSWSTEDVGAFLAAERQFLDAAKVLLAAFHRVKAVGKPVRENLAQRLAGLHQFRRQAVEPGVLGVADDQAPLPVEHAQALRHVVDCGGETHVLQRQCAFAILELRVLLTEVTLADAQQLDVVPLLGDVVIERQPAVPAEGVVGDRDRSPVGKHAVEVELAPGGQRLAGARLGLFASALVFEQAWAMVENLGKPGAGLQDVIGNCLDVAVGRIPCDDAEIGIPDAGAGANAFQKRDKLIRRKTGGEAAHAADRSPCAHRIRLGQSPARMTGTSIGILHLIRD